MIIAEVTVAKIIKRRGRQQWRALVRATGSQRFRVLGDHPTEREARAAVEEWIKTQTDKNEG